MTLLDLFNETLKKVPSISKGLEEFIIEHSQTYIIGWTDEKTKQAVIILRQLQQEENLLTCGYCLDHQYVELKQLKITLTPRECGIDADTFESGNIFNADKYVKSLLEDLNECTSEITFYLEGFYPNKGEFFIGWSF